MSEKAERPYIPRSGAPTVMFLSALLLATALPTAFFVQGRTPPLWLTAISFAIVLAALLLVPGMNARAKPVKRSVRVFNGAAIIGAIVVPALLLTVGAITGSPAGWPVIALAVQFVLLLACAVLATCRPVRT